MSAHPLQVLTFNGGSGVRIFGTADAPLFCAADVCKCLGIDNARDAIRRLDQEERDDVVSTDTIGRPQTLTVVNESGLYSLILSSRKPEAKAFKRWVTSEVLPTIRKTGRYDIEEAARKLAFKHFLLELPADWRRTFSDDWFSAVLGVYGLDYIKARTPGFVGSFINEYVYEALVSGLPAELKARREECGSDKAKLHQFLTSEAKEKLSEHLAVVKALAANNLNNPDGFREMFDRVFRGRNQLLLNYRQPKRKGKAT
jgi:prophage antirepressor-like protein